MRARRLTVCAQTGGCICRLTVCSQAVCAGRRLYMQACGERKQQTSSAMTGGERGGICGLMCARKWGRGAQACVHKFQKPEKRLAAVVPRCADVRIHKCRPRCMTAAGEALCRLTACEIRRYRCRRRALSPACGGAKGGAVSQTCIRKRTLSLGKQTAARAGESRRYQPSPAMIWTKLRIYERTGDCIRRLGAQTDAALSARLRRTSRREGLRACESRQYRSVVRK